MAYNSQGELIDSNVSAKTMVDATITRKAIMMLG